MIHKSLGLAILALMILRIIWIAHCGRVKLPQTMPDWEKGFARFVQYALTLLLLAMPLSGWIMSVAADKTPSFFGLFQAPLPIAPNKALAGLMNTTHKAIAWTLIVLVFFHIAGALKHHFIDKDGVLSSMLRGQR